MQEERELIFSARKKDFRVDYFRCGGPGGQNQNKVNSGCRITHISSGLSSESRVHKSQAQNKKEAFRKLCDLLVDHYIEEPNKERYGAGYELVRTYHEPNNRVTEHSDGSDYSYKHTVGKGDLSEVIDHRRDICQTKKLQ